jgi:predicted ATPase
MLTRLYLNNFRCFVNFEYRPARRELIMGPNGSGKSSLLSALHLLRQFAIDGTSPEIPNLLAHRTRWAKTDEITLEIEADLGGGIYDYQVVVDAWGNPPRARVAFEILHFDRKPIFDFTNGEVQLYNDRFVRQAAYPFDWSRPALATIVERADNQKLTRFKAWLDKTQCFRINPFAMEARAEGEQLSPSWDLSNLAAWYRHLVQAYPEQSAALMTSLRESLDGFAFLRLDPFGENVRLLAAEFGGAGGSSTKYYLNELSDGQRCLIGLYTILHFVVAKGGTVLLDEPDNFVSLREIQPWLTAATDMVEDSKGQVIIISHHPEIINQWAPASGVQFTREGAGPVRVRKFPGDSSSCLPPSELIARGWERE